MSHVTEQSDNRWTTLTEAAGILNRSPNNLSQLCSKARIRPRAKDGLYPLDKIAKAVQESAERDLRNAPGAGQLTHLKADRLREEIGILKAKRAELEGRSVLRETVDANVRELVAMFRDVLSQWCAAVRVMTADPALVAEAERLRDKALGQMKERVAP